MEDAFLAFELEPEILFVDGDAGRIRLGHSSWLLLERRLVLVNPESVLFWHEEVVRRASVVSCVAQDAVSIRTIRLTSGGAVELAFPQMTLEPGAKDSNFLDCLEAEMPEADG
jgi:hypothetical protein